MKIELEKINGVEIIDYLNAISDDDIEELLDVSCSQPYIFEKQEMLEDGRYKLTFSAYYNNWVLTN